MHQFPSAFPSVIAYNIAHYPCSFLLSFFTRNLKILGITPIKTSGHSVLFKTDAEHRATDAGMAH